MFKAALKIIANNKGQQTVEFVLMLGVVVSVIMAAVASFHKQLAGGFFTIIGNILS